MNDKKLIGIICLAVSATLTVLGVMAAEYAASRWGVRAQYATACATYLLSVVLFGVGCDLLWPARGSQRRNRRRRAA